MERKPILEVQNVNKSFGTNKVLKDVNFTINQGSIYSLVGRNGAGKSTVVNIIAGVYRLTSGNIIFEGKNINELDFKERQNVGIRLVTQHASVVLDLTVAENLAIGLWPKSKLKLIDKKVMHEKAVDVLKEFGLNVDTHKLVRDLTPVEQRKLNIIRALFYGGKLVILDEPTTSLSIEDRDNLFGFVKEHAKKGITFILISHYLEEILKVSDDITVLRDGYAFESTMSSDAKDMQMELAKLIAGEDVELTYRDENKVVSSEVAVECKDISAKYLNPMSIKLHKGEVIGFVGLTGSGAREFCLALSGLIPKYSGTISIDGKQIKIANSTDALNNKICLVPNDRHAEGIVSILSIKKNIGFSSLGTDLAIKFGLISPKKEKQIAEYYVEKLAIKTQSIETPSGNLSGGNQQKVVLGKVLAAHPTLLILDEPTIGIDIKSREEIMSIIKELTNQGMTVIYLTNDFDEFLRIVDRVVVFNGGNVIGDVPNKDLTPERITNIRDGRAE